MQAATQLLNTLAFPCAHIVPTDVTPTILLSGHSTGKVKPVLQQGQGISQGAQAPEFS